jgi:hypothetical protein
MEQTLQQQRQQQGEGTVGAPIPSPLEENQSRERTGEPANREERKEKRKKNNGGKKVKRGTGQKSGRAAAAPLQVPGGTHQTTVEQ